MNQRDRNRDINIVKNKKKIIVFRIVTLSVARQRAENRFLPKTGRSENERGKNDSSGADRGRGGRKINQTVARSRSDVTASGSWVQGIYVSAGTILI